MDEAEETEVEAVEVTVVGARPAAVTEVPPEAAAVASEDSPTLNAVAV